MKSLSLVLFPARSMDLEDVPLDDFADAFDRLYSTSPSKAVEEKGYADERTNQLAAMLGVEESAVADPSLVYDTSNLPPASPLLVPDCVEEVVYSFEEEEEVGFACNDDKEEGREVYGWSSADEKYVPEMEVGRKRKRKKSGEPSYKWCSTSETWVEDVESLPIAAEGKVRAKNACWQYVRAALSDTGHDLKVPEFTDEFEGKTLKDVFKGMTEIVDRHLRQRSQKVPPVKGPYVYQKCLVKHASLCGDTMDSLHERFQGGEWRKLVSRGSLGNLSSDLMAAGALGGVKAAQTDGKGSPVYFYLG